MAQILENTINFVSKIKKSLWSKNDHKCLILYVEMIMTFIIKILSKIPINVPV